MIRKLRLVMLCCFAVILFSAALSGCAAPSLDDVFAKIEKMQYTEIDMSIRVENNGQNTDVATIFLYGEGKSVEDFFIHMVIDADDNSQEIYINNDYLYVCNDKELIGMMSMVIPEDYQNYEDASDADFAEFLLLQFEDIEYSMTQEELPKGRTAFDFTVDKAAMTRLFGGLVGDFATCKMRLTVKNITKLAESMYIEFNVGTSKIICEADYKFKKNKKEKLPEELRNAVKEEAGLKYELNADKTGYTVTGYQGFSNTVNVPAAYKGLPVTAIESWALLNNTTAKYITLPESITSIGVFSFSNCAIKSLSLPSNLTYIGESAFEDSNIETIVIPENVEYIGKNVFRNCHFLQKVEIESEKLKFLPENAFMSCGALEEINSDNEVVDVSNFSTLGRSAFKGCRNIKSLVLSSNLTEIPENFCAKCSYLENIVLPESIASIGDYAFQNVLGLVSLDIPSTVIRIGEYAFSECNLLETVNLHEGLEVIGNNAFFHCSMLTSIILPRSLITIGDSAFGSCGELCEIIIPENVETIGVAPFFWCGNLTAIEVEEANAYFTSVDGVLYDKSLNTLFEYPAGKTAAEYAVLDGVSVISHEAFAGICHLEYLTLPSSIEQIGMLMYLNSLKRITLFAVEPPIMGYSIYVPIYVPSQSVDAYKAEFPWCNSAIYPIIE